MAERGLSLDEDMLSCSICLDLLNDPVTIPCGHNYCCVCIQNHWKRQEQKEVYSCPQCREGFSPRPALGRNTMLAELVGEVKKTGLQERPNPHLYVGPGDVGCDFCTGRKMKATKSCLQCLASYCDLHLQPHYDSPAFQTHKLVTASADIQENICSVHSKLKEIFCRSDQQAICYLCSVDEHRGHDTVSAAAERAIRQQEIGPTRQSIQQRLQGRENDLELLQKEGDTINSSADNTVENIQSMFDALLQLLARRSSDVQQQVRSQQETEMGEVKKLQERVQGEISELNARDKELERLSHTEDHIQFLRRYTSLTSLDPSKDSAINIPSSSYFSQVKSAASELIHKLQDTLNQEWTKISTTKADRPPTQPEVLPSPLSILSRARSMDSPPVGSPSAASPTKSQTKSMPPRSLKSFDSNVHIYSNMSSVVPTAPIYISSKEPKTLKPINPTPDESQASLPGGHLQKDSQVSSPTNPKPEDTAALSPSSSRYKPLKPTNPTPEISTVSTPSGYPTKSSSVPTAPTYTSSSESKTLKSTYPTPDESEASLPGGHLQTDSKVPSQTLPTPENTTVLPPPAYPTPRKSSFVPTALTCIPSSESKASQPPAYSATTESKVPPPKAYPMPNQSKAPSPDLRQGKSTFPPPPSYPSLDNFKVLPAPTLQPEEPKTRSEFLQHACQITLDPNTAHKLLVVSGQNMRVARGKKKLFCPSNPERFSDRFQVLSKESLTGRCYWEVEWSGIVSVAVSYNHIVRAGATSGFGDNKLSWALYCHNGKYIHDGGSIVLPEPLSSRVGVYLDHNAGILSFYSISSTMVLLHRVHTAFTEPLHAGICVGSGSAEILQLT